jgi:adaptin ear-binding coat-associated protein 1/2
MTTVDPSTGRPLPADAIQRVLFVSPKVHVYNIPPLTSTKGYTASTWTADNNKRQIFTARLRVLETAIPIISAPSPGGAIGPQAGGDEGGEKVTTDIVLEDPATGQLFAAAPYNVPAAVEQVLDSSRFFAIRVQGEGGRKAVLGIGFEERSEAFDFGVTLQEVRRGMGMDNVVPAGGRGGGKQKVVEAKEPAREDFSLKEGDTITVNIGGKGRRARKSEDGNQGGDSSALFSIGPPPGAGGAFLPPPPSAQDVKAERRKSRQMPAPGALASFEPPTQQHTQEDLGFDDGEFGEFQ